MYAQSQLQKSKVKPLAEKWSRRSKQATFKNGIGYYQQPPKNEFVLK